MKTQRHLTVGNYSLDSDEIRSLQGRLHHGSRLLQRTCGSEASTRTYMALRVKGFGGKLILRPLTPEIQRSWMQACGEYSRWTASSLTTSLGYNGYPRAGNERMSAHNVKKGMKCTQSNHGSSLFTRELSQVHSEGTADHFPSFPFVVGFIPLVWTHFGAGLINGAGLQLPRNWEP